MTLTHQEGNGNNINKEHDEGLNNFKGSLKEEEPTEPPATEPPATEPPATEPPATEPPVADPPAAPQNDPGREPVVISGDGPITIFDEDVPLADVPKTGDISLLWMLLSGASTGGLILLNKKCR